MKNVIVMPPASRMMEVKARMGRPAAMMEIARSGVAVDTETGFSDCVATHKVSPMASRDTQLSG